MWLFESRPECWLEINRYTICCYTRFFFCTKLALFFFNWNIHSVKNNCSSSVPCGQPWWGVLRLDWHRVRHCLRYAWQCCEEELTGTSWHTVLWTHCHTGMPAAWGEGHLLLSRMDQGWAIWQRISRISYWLDQWFSSGGSGPRPKWPLSNFDMVLDMINTLLNKTLKKCYILILNTETRSKCKLEINIFTWVTACQASWKPLI